MYIYIYTYVCIYLSLSIYIYIYMYIDMYVCVYIYIYICMPCAFASLNIVLVQPHLKLNAAHACEYSKQGHANKLMVHPQGPLSSHLRKVREYRRPIWTACMSNMAWELQWPRKTEIANTSKHRHSEEPRFRLPHPLLAYVTPSPPIKSFPI